jgi:hypothetical protein
MLMLVLNCAVPVVAASVGAVSVPLFTRDESRHVDRSHGQGRRSHAKASLYRAFSFCPLAHFFR